MPLFIERVDFYMNRVLLLYLIVRAAVNCGNNLAYIGGTYVMCVERLFPILCIKGREKGQEKKKKKNLPQKQETCKIKK